MFNRRRLLLLCLFCVACGVIATSPRWIRFLISRGSAEHPGFYQQTYDSVGFAEGDAELDRLQKRFGEKFYSWHYEEWFIRDFFDDMKGGVFVDVGAWLYSLSSNTFFLENRFGWSGIAVDAQDGFRSGYEEHRPRTKYFTYFVSDTSAGQAELFVPMANTAVASGDKAHLDRHSLEATETIQVAEITLDDLLDREGVKRIDFLSMDIETHEPAALRGFDIRRFEPRLVCIEDDPTSERHSFIKDYFERAGYAELELWSRIDSYNSYYAPRALVEARAR